MHAMRFLSLLGLCALLVAGAASAQPTLVNYQGQLDENGSPYDGNADFKFVILCGTSTSAWSNNGSSAGGNEPTAAVTLAVAQGLFQVNLGDPALGMVPLTANLINTCSNPRLRIWVNTGSGFEQLSDLPLASSPFALVSDAAKRSLSDFSVNGQLIVNNGDVTILDGNTKTITMDSSTGQVGLNRIRFDDGSVLSSANGLGADSDWTISGSNMYSGVPGNVGIGLTSPGAKLHLVGDARFDGSNGNGLDLRNPNATTANLRLGWLNNLARLRIGGSGSGFNNGLDIQGSAESSLLRILDNGNIGIGVTSPTARLDVNGDLRVRNDLIVDGSFDVAGVGVASGIYTISGASMGEEENDMQFHRSSVTLHGLVAGGGLTFETDVILPHGVQIQSFTAYMTDSDATRNIQTFLTSKPLSGAVGAIIATQATSGTPGRVAQTSSGLTTIVDNDNNIYSVSCNWTTPTTVTNIRLHGFKIVYGPAGS
jgi:hypothetical protein